MGETVDRHAGEMADGGGKVFELRFVSHLIGHGRAVDMGLKGWVTGYVLHLLPACINHIRLLLQALYIVFFGSNHVHLHFPTRIHRKSETRNPKSETNPKYRNSNVSN